MKDSVCTARDVYTAATFKDFYLSTESPAAARLETIKRELQQHWRTCAYLRSGLYRQFLAGLVLSLSLTRLLERNEPISSALNAPGYRLCATERERHTGTCIIRSRVTRAVNLSRLQCMAKNLSLSRERGNCLVYTYGRAISVFRIVKMRGERNLSRIVKNLTAVSMLCAARWFDFYLSIIYSRGSAESAIRPITVINKLTVGLVVFACV